MQLAGKPAMKSCRQLQAGSALREERHSKRMQQGRMLWSLSGCHAMT